MSITRRNAPREKTMDAIPETMRAIDPEAPGGPEVLTVVERPVPKPGAGDVLIRVAASVPMRPRVMRCSSTAVRRGSARWRSRLGSCSG